MRITRKEETLGEELHFLLEWKTTRPLSTSAALDARCVWIERGREASTRIRLNISQRVGRYLESKVSERISKF